MHPMDAALTRRCPICGQEMVIGDPKGYTRAIREHTRIAHPGYYIWMRRFRILIIPVFALSFTLAILPAIFFQNLGYYLARVVVIAGVLAPLLALGLLARYVVKSFQRSWTMERGTQGQPITPTLAFPKASQPGLPYGTQGIVGVARDLGQKLDLSGFEPESASWQDYYTRGFKLSRILVRSPNRLMMVPYDGCIFQGRQIILPESTRDKLQLAEWAPLLASELIYQRQLLERRRLGLLIRILPLTVLYIMIAVVLWQLGDPQSSRNDHSSRDPYSARSSLLRGLLWHSNDLRNDPVHSAGIALRQKDEAPGRPTSTSNDWKTALSFSLGKDRPSLPGHHDSRSSFCNLLTR